MKDTIKVMIADVDDNWICILTNKLKEYSKLELVGIASTGTDLLDMIRENVVDLVISNLILPEKDALFVMSMVRKEGIQTKFFILCPTYNEEIISLLYDEGASQVFLRPYDATCLLGRVIDCTKRDPTKQAKVPVIAKPKLLPLELEVHNELAFIGIRYGINGRDYIREFVMMAITNPVVLKSVVSTYRVIAERHDTTYTAVERCIRDAIEYCWENGNYDHIIDVFGYSCRPDKGRPTNLEFLAGLTDYIRLKRKYINW